MICNCYRNGLKVCACGAVKDGVLVQGATIHIPLMMTDGVPQGRKEIHMMTDAERHTMRDSVRGMPLYQAEKLPIYDDVRGRVMSGMPAERYCALIDGADGKRSVAPTEENVRRLGDSLGARLHYERDMANAWRTPVNDNRR